MSGGLAERESARAEEVFDGFFEGFGGIDADVFGESDERFGALGDGEVKEGEAGSLVLVEDLQHLASGGFGEIGGSEVEMDFAGFFVAGGDEGAYFGTFHADLVFVGFGFTANKDGFVAVKERGDFAVEAWEDGDFDGAGHIFDHDKGHGFAFFGDHAAFGGDDASDSHFATARIIGEIGDICGDEAFDVFFEALEGMAGDVKAEDLFFLLEAFFFGPVFEEGDLGFGWRGGACEEIEHRDLAAAFVFLEALAVLDGVVHDSDERGAVDGFDAIEGTGLDQGFDHALVDGFEVDALAKVVDAGKGAAFAGLDDRVDGVFADAFDASEAKADLVTDGDKASVGFVDVGRKDLDFVLAAIVEIEQQFVGVSGICGEKRSHVFVSVVGF